MSTVRDEAVIWHDVECGGYPTDLPLWRELARAAGGPVLEIGCGTGRVALDLARHGHEVTAVDNDAALVDELRDRATARGLDVGAHVADARAMSLGGRFGLVVIPMQMLHLVVGPAERRAVLGTAREHLAAGGVIAASIVEGVPAGEGEVAPLPDVAEIDGWIYSSLPLDISAEGEGMRVTRLRQVVSPDGDLTETLEETRLAILDAERLEAEARETGLEPHGRRTVAATDAHVGSTVVLLRDVP